MLIFILAIMATLLVLIEAYQPHYNQLSSFELNHRASHGDKEARHTLKRESLLNEVELMRNVLVLLLLVAIVMLSLVAFDEYWIGVVVPVVLALILRPLAATRIVKAIAKFTDKHIEKMMIVVATKVPIISKFLGFGSVARQSNIKIGSRHELQHLINSSGGVLSEEERNLVVGGLSFNDILVEAVMTPRDKIISIDKSEFLGPLNLNEFHQKGHTLLPVTSTDIHHIVGLLNITNLLALSIKKSTTAEKAMDPNVYYIRNDQKLIDALAAFIKTHSGILIVVNKSRETVGLISLSDIVNKLFGRSIDNVFDSYGSARDVAAQK
jgi:CBS domain containing-hemolysin-like protein